MDEGLATWIGTQESKSYDNARYIINNATGPLLALRGFALMRPVIDDLEFCAVRDARERHCTWEQIAEAMNRQRQAVWKQYAPLLSETATETDLE